MTASDEDPIDVAQLKADDELVEELVEGYTPETPDGVLGKMLGAWRDEARPQDHKDRE